MIARELLATLADHRVALFLEGGNLRYRAPAGALTRDLRNAIAANRAAIIEHVRDQHQNSEVHGTRKCVMCTSLF